MRPFEPFFRNNHLLTIAANFWPRDFRHNSFPETFRLFDTEPGVRVLAVESTPRSEPKGDVVILHGLEGSHLSGYCVSLSQRLLENGYRTFRLNMRTCGGTEQHCATLYHAGLTTDLKHVVEEVHREARRPIYLAGFSLGGNVVLKFTGESGAALQGVVAGAISISTPIDLAACCRQMMRLENRVYEWRFISRLRDRYMRRCLQHPDRYKLEHLNGIKTVYGFDDAITAKHFGFGDAEGYYGTQSSKLFLAGIEIPTLMIQAEDDPLIPFSVYAHPSISANRHIQLAATPHGGHVGFISRRLPRFWVDEVISHWLEENRNATT